MAFNESQHSRTPTGVSTGGQFAVKAAAESPVDLAAHAVADEGAFRFSDGSFAQVETSEASDREQWVFTSACGTASPSGLAPDAHHAAVAAWLTEARAASDEELAGFAVETRNRGLVKAVAALMEGVATGDEGGGPAIWFGTRSVDGMGESDYAYPDNEGEGLWRFHAGDIGVQNDKGHYGDVVISDMGAGTDPEVVAAWIREQAQRFGSVPYAG